MATPGHQFQQMMPGSQVPQQATPPYPGGPPGPAGGQQGMMGQPNQPGQIPPQMMSPTKEPNAITLCKRGQEFVQDIVAKVTEVFKQLQTKQMPLPNLVTCNSQSCMEKRTKLEENLQTLAMGFKKLRLFYEKVNEMSKDCDGFTEESLIPIEGQPFEDKTSTSTSEVYFRYVVEENRDIIEQLEMKNRELKEIIDQMRTIIWEINTMLVMRKT